MAWKKKDKDVKGFDIKEFIESYKDGKQIINEWMDDAHDRKIERYQKIEETRRKFGLKPSKKYGGTK